MLNVRDTYRLAGLLSLSLLIAAPAAAQILPSFGGDRAGTSGFQFLKVPVDARSAALGETVVATANDASSLFWNPALASQQSGLVLGFAHTAYFADVSMEYFAASYHLGRGGIALGLSLQSLNSGTMDVTTEFEPFGTGETFRLGDIAVGLSMSQRLTDLFSYGVTAKYIRESVAGVNAATVLFDLGIFYRIGTTGAQMAVAVRNFGPDTTPSGRIERSVIGPTSPLIEEDFESITPPTTFLLGFSYDVFHSDPDNSLVVTAQLNNPNDNAETWNAGAEYTWNRTLVLRTGYRFGVEEYSWPSFGFGVAIPRIGPDVRFDYGFTRLDRLGNVHRVGINVGV